MFSSIISGEASMAAVGDYDRIDNESVRFDLEVPGAGTWWCTLRSTRRERQKKLGSGKACDLKLQEERLADTTWNQSKEGTSLECAKNVSDFGILSKKTMFLSMEAHLNPFT